MTARGTVDRVVEIVATAARSGQPAPSNKALATRLGVSRITAIAALAAAERQRAITIHRGQCTRVITAADGSWCTAGPIPAPHHTRRPSP